MTLNSNRPTDNDLWWSDFGRFAGLLGGNAALFVGGIQFFPHSSLVGSTWFVSYVTVVIATLVLWRLRKTIARHLSSQIGIGISGVCWLISFCILIFVRPDLLRVVSFGPVRPSQQWLFDTLQNFPLLALLPLLIFPLLMIYLHQLHKRVRTS